MNNKYIMSFTAGALLHQQSVNLAELYFAVDNWDTLRDKVMSENILQARTMSSAKRLCSEIISRLQTLNTAELNFLMGGSYQDQSYLLWLAVCRRYKFIGDFAVEVLHERYITLKNDLGYKDFDSFFNQKSEWHSELEKLTPTTVGKLRQVLFKMLREADLLTANNMVNSAILSPKLLDVIESNDILYFPFIESNLKGL